MEKSISSCDYLPTNADLCLKFSKSFLIHDCFFHLGEKKQLFIRRASTFKHFEQRNNWNIVSKEVRILYF